MRSHPQPRQMPVDIDGNRLNCQPQNCAPEHSLKQHAQPVSLSSDALFGTAHEVRIEHNGEIYRLQKTRTQKLILTK